MVIRCAESGVPCLLETFVVHFLRYNLSSKPVAIILQKNK